MKFVFYLSLLLIFIHYIIYPLILYVHFLFFFKDKKDNKFEFNKDKFPLISIIIPVHNEEKIIQKKIENVLSLNYPKDRLEIIFSDDNSTDNTLNILKCYADKNNVIKIVNNKKRGGKVNAQNNAVRQTIGEIIFFSDANSIWDKDALIKLVSAFSDESIVCVCGRLIYTNELDSETSKSESLYWKIENKLKELESKFYSLTAINGSIYGVRRDYYLFLNPMFSHDIAFPLIFASKRKKTVFIKEAKAFEKSGLTTKDEWKRKIRMFGSIYYFLYKNLNLFINPLIYDFRFFISVLSHRTIRYLLPFIHILLFISSLFLYKLGGPYMILFNIQILFLFFVIIGGISEKFKFLKKFYLFYYYFIFIISMLIGFINFVFGRVKPYWEIVETTRI